MQKSIDKKVTQPISNYTFVFVKVILKTLLVPFFSGHYVFSLNSVNYYVTNVSDHTNLSVGVAKIEFVEQMAE